MCAARAEAERNGGELNLEEVAARGEDRFRNQALPDFRIGREAARVVRRASIIEVGRCRVERQMELVVAFLRLKANHIVFEDEIRKTVEDRLPFIDLDSA